MCVFVPAVGSGISKCRLVVPCKFSTFVRHVLLRSRQCRCDACFTSVRMAPSLGGGGALCILLLLCSLCTPYVGCLGMLAASALRPGKVHCPSSRSVHLYSPNAPRFFICSFQRLFVRVRVHGWSSDMLGPTMFYFLCCVGRAQRPLPLSSYAHRTFVGVFLGAAGRPAQRTHCGVASGCMPSRGVFGHNLWGGLVHPQGGCCLHVLTGCVVRPSAHLPLAVVVGIRFLSNCSVPCR